MKIGVLVDSQRQQPSWIVEILERLDAHADFQLQLFQASVDSTKRENIGWVGRIARSLERRVVPNPYQAAVRPRPIPQPILSAAQSVAEMNQAALDLCFATIPTPSPPQGPNAVYGSTEIWFVDGNDSVMYGQPDVLLGNSISTLAVKSLKDGELSLVEVSRVDCEFAASRNLAKLLSAVPDTLMRGLNRYRLQCASEGDSPSDLAQHVFVQQNDSKIASPHSHSELAYLMRLLKNLFLKSIFERSARTARKLLGNGEPGYWTVRFGSLEESVANWKTIDLNPKSRWVADPFLMVTEFAKFVLFEDWDVARKIGKISAINVAEPSQIFSVLNLPHHLSYPFTFRRANDWYMIPECNQSGKVTLYRVDFSDDGQSFQLEEVRVLLEGEFVDTTVVRLDNHDYLLTNPRKPYSKSFRSALEVYLCDDLTNPTAELKPHPLNPVVIDPVLGRNGGRTVGVDGDISKGSARFTIRRLSQKNDRKYGEALVESHVAIDEQSFQTIDFRILELPDACARTHHFDFCEGHGTRDLYFDH